ncbi:hypothetical protein F5Y04DRAFT_208047 [Hypomontagnella monticulosa]|nr:hypothetical protein F5Y04DRAFT_208047 [Hypomontagnella monticulosa]
MRHLVVLLSQTLSVWRMIGALDQSYNKTGSAGDDDQHAGRQGQYNRGISPSPPGNLVRRQSNGANDDWFSCYSSGSGHNQSIQSLPSPPEQPRCPPPRWFIVCKNIGNRAWKPAHISSHSLSHDTELVEALDKHWRKVNGIYGSCFGWIRVNRPLVRRVNIITDDYENGQEVAHPMERWGPGPDVDDAMNWDPIPPTERPPDADSWELHMDYLINHRTKRLFWKGTELFCWVISHTKSFLNRLLTSILLCASGIAKRVGFPGHNITDGLSGLEEIVVDNHPGHAHTMSHRILTGLSKRQNIKLRARPNECTFGWAILLRTSVRPPPSMVLLSFILLFVFSIGTIVTCFILLPTAGWDVFSFTGAPTLVVAVVTLLYATLASLA